MKFSQVKLLLAYWKLRSLPKKEVSFSGKSFLQNVGVILERTDEDVVASFMDLLKCRGAGVENVVFIFCSPAGSVESYADKIVFESADISWTGRIKNPKVASFLDRDFDVLISFTDRAKELSDYLVTASGAALKVGRRQDKEIFDLVISTTIEEIGIFTSELHKYLRIINY